MQVFWVDAVGLIFEIDYSLIGLKSLTIQLAFNGVFSGVFHKLGKVGISDIRGFNK